MDKQGGRSGTSGCGIKQQISQLDFGALMKELDSKGLAFTLSDKQQETLEEDGVIPRKVKNLMEYCCAVNMASSFPRSSSTFAYTNNVLACDKITFAYTNNVCI